MGADVKLHAVVLRLGEEEFGIDLSIVKEIVRYEKVSHLPRASDLIEGVLELRGHIIVLMDLRKRLGISRCETSDKTRIIIVKVRKMIVGLITDGVRQVLDFPPEAVHPAPALMKSQIDHRYISKMVRWENRIIFMLELEKVFSGKDKENLLKMKRQDPALKPSGESPEDSEAGAQTGSAND